MLATIFVCLCKHNSIWLANDTYACTNETHSIANQQDLIPTLASWFVLPIIIAAKVGIKSCKFAIECVSLVHKWMYLAKQLKLCLH